MHYTCAQGLTFDHLAFDSSDVTKYGLTYTTLYRIKCIFIIPIIQRQFPCRSNCVRRNDLS